MTSFIFRSHIHGQVRTEWAVVCLQSLIQSSDPFLFESWVTTSLRVCVHLIYHFNTSSSFSLLPSEPPEAYIDNEHDEKDAAGSQLGIGGAGVQILGVTPVLL